MTADVQDRSPARYGSSALVSAVPLMGRAAVPALGAIAGNAAVQAVLMYLNAPSGFSPAFLVSFAVSVVAALALYAALAAAALQAADGRAAAGAVVGRARRHAGPFTLWVALQWLLVLAAALVHPFLIALVAVLTPFLPLAAMDGRSNALVANAGAIGERTGRWLVTSAVLLVGGLLLFLATVATTLFVKGTPAAFLFWAAIGLVAWWVLTAWALVYRSTTVGRQR